MLLQQTSLDVTVSKIANTDFETILIDRNNQVDFFNPKGLKTELLNMKSYVYIHSMVL